MSIAFDFVGTNVGSGTKTYNINFLKEIELLSLREDIIIFLTKNYFQQLKKHVIQTLNVEWYHRLVLLQG